MHHSFFSINLFRLFFQTNPVARTARWCCTSSRVSVLLAPKTLVQGSHADPIFGVFLMLKLSAVINYTWLCIQSKPSLDLESSTKRRVTTRRHNSRFAWNSWPWRAPLFSMMTMMACRSEHFRSEGSWGSCARKADPSAPVHQGLRPKFASLRKTRRFHTLFECFRFVHFACFVCIL